VMIGRVPQNRVVVSPFRYPAFRLVNCGVRPTWASHLEFGSPGEEHSAPRRLGRSVERREEEERRQSALC